MGRNVFGIEANKDFVYNRFAKTGGEIEEYDAVPVSTSSEGLEGVDVEEVGELWVDLESDTAKIGINAVEDILSPDAISNPIVVPAAIVTLEPSEPPIQKTLFASDLMDSPGSGGYGELSAEASRDGGETWSSSLIFTCADDSSAVTVRVRWVDEQGNTSDYGESLVTVEGGGMAGC